MRDCDELCGLVNPDLQSCENKGRGQKGKVNAVSNSRHTPAPSIGPHCWRGTLSGPTPCHPQDKSQTRHPLMWASPWLSSPPLHRALPCQTSFCSPGVPCTPLRSPADDLTRWPLIQDVSLLYPLLLRGVFQGPAYVELSESLHRRRSHGVLLFPYLRTGGVSSEFFVLFSSFLAHVRVMIHLVPQGLARCLQEGGRNKWLTIQSSQKHRKQKQKQNNDQTSAREPSACKSRYSGGNRLSYGPYPVFVLFCFPSCWLNNR